LAIILSSILYLTCALAFIVVVALVLLRGRTSRTGAAIVFCCLLSAVWAGAAAFPAALPAGMLSVLNSARVSAWLLFTIALLAQNGFPTGRYYVIGAVALIAVTIGNDLYLLALDPLAYAPHPLQLLLCISISVAGLLAVENLWRNTDATRRWHIWPLSLAIGGLFAYDLFLFADAFMNRNQFNSSLALGQAIVAIFMTPLLTLAMARNREWRVDIHVSRQVVLHTAALVASGAFLLSVAIAGTLLRGFGGAWGPPLQLAMLIGSLFVLAVVLSSESPWRKLNRLISHNFYSHRYDYRAEWLKFIDLVSDPGHIETLQVRIIRALAEFVDSPAGVLWSLTGDIGYHPTAAWKLPLPAEGKLSREDTFIAGFRGSGWIQQRLAEPAMQAWPFAPADAWLAVPLTHHGDLVGFVFLSRPHQAFTLDWESFDLLRAAGRQAASYLAEERSTKALLDAALLTDYTKRFAFVVHDIKNLASQLGLTVTNAHRYIDDPEFQRDMLDTIRDAVARMNHLLSRLKVDAEPRRALSLNPEGIIAEVAAGFAGGSVLVESQIDLETGAVAIGAEQLRSALIHLVQNAIDASPPDEPVTLRSQRLGNELVIEVIDRGAGMDASFVGEELFLPLRSTKSGGHGIGAFQTRELIRMSGGDLTVISKKGVGTTMRITLPLAAGQQQPAAPSAAA
jgi:putative PEP-CTERM system histidine kinase